LETDEGLCLYTDSTPPASLSMNCGHFSKRVSQGHHSTSTVIDRSFGQSGIEPKSYDGIFKSLNIPPTGVCRGIRD
jgi:hypothetical protein